LCAALPTPAPIPTVAPSLASMPPVAIDNCMVRYYRDNIFVTTMIVANRSNHPLQSIEYQYRYYAVDRSGRTRPIAQTEPKVRRLKVPAGEGAKPGLASFTEAVQPAPSPEVLSPPNAGSIVPTVLHFMQPLSSVQQVECSLTHWTFATPTPRP
jgi:hypothetical protein